MAKHSPCIMIMAGGTGGHIYPALAVARCLQAQNIRTVWLGSKHGLENRIIPEQGIKLIRVFVSGLRGGSAMRWLAAPFILFIALLQSLKAMLTERPSAVLGMGGFASGPGGIAAWISRTPLIIHEQNARAGSTNKILSRFASKVFQAFPDTFKQVDAITVGNPVREEIAALTDLPLRKSESEGLNLLILGGSRGARYINNHVPDVLTSLSTQTAEPKLRVKHQCGDSDIETTRALYNHSRIEAEVVPFIEDMAAAYRWADLIICRAGAMTISELAAAGRASVLIPFPYATDDHQTLNAKYLVEHDAAVLMPQGDDFDQRLTAALGALFDKPCRLTQMGRKAHELAITDAAQRVARRCLELANV